MTFAWILIAFAPYKFIFITVWPKYGKSVDTTQGAQNNVKSWFLVKTALYLRVHKIVGISFSFGLVMAEMPDLRVVGKWHCLNFFLYEH
jgi:hypothetical protein